ncbi:hypothetical protein FKP32DRAFT_879280 [Trametes sanguinea]|nr:hypothetical protein FKP32DRAFT_879280 [Trametes sanguinea]
MEFQARNHVVVAMSTAWPWLEARGGSHSRRAPPHSFTWTSIARGILQSCCFLCHAQDPSAAQTPSAGRDPMDAMRSTHQSVPSSAGWQLARKGNSGLQQQPRRGCLKCHASRAQQ